MYLISCLAFPSRFSAGLAKPIPDLSSSPKADPVAVFPNLKSVLILPIVQAKNLGVILESPLSVALHF